MNDITNEFDFEKIKRENERKKKRLEEERRKNNKKTKREYNLPEKQND
jgi:hypothetical protein